MIGDVPVEDVRPGQTLVLPSGKRVTAYGSTRYDDGTIVVHWERPAQRGEPGFDVDGRYLGSFAGKRPGETVRVEGLSAVPAE